jgi:hypothetical protein
MALQQATSNCISLCLTLRVMNCDYVMTWTGPSLNSGTTDLTHDSKRGYVTLEEYLLHFSVSFDQINSERYELYLFSSTTQKMNESKLQSL